jgi:hypothetical protein
VTITRKSLADTIDEYDAEIADLQSGKRDTFNSYRADLVAAGLSKDAVKAEIEAAKKAIRRRQIIAAKSVEVVEEADALAEEIFEEITASRAPRATRVETPHEFGADVVVVDNVDEDGNRLVVTVDSRIAEILNRPGPAPDHDPETGEILGITPHPVDHETVGRHAREPRPDVSSQPIQESRDATSSPLEDSGGFPSSAGTEGDKTGNRIQPETATTSTEQPIAAAEVTTPDANTHGQTGTAHHSGLAASGPANAEAVAKKAKKVGQSEQEAAIELPVDTNLYAFTPKPLRPHCLRPLLCGGMGKDHCPSCQLAMAESKRATA